MDVGGVRVGVRATSEGLLELLRQAFGPYVVAGAYAPADLSVQVGPRGDGGKARGFHLLFRGGQRVLRTRDPDRLARALVAHVWAHQPVAGGVLSLPGVALVRDGEGLAACLAVRSSFDLIERRLNANGLVLVDEPFVLIDPATAELVVPERAVAVDWSALGRVEEVVGGQRRVEPAAEPGRYRLAAWSYVMADDRPAVLSPEQGVVWGAHLASSIGHTTHEDAVRALGCLAERVRPTAVSWQEVASGTWCGG
ncbi:MAG TPA: hypothetical protein VG078_01535 [Acidimicrobiales bacterium]|nr:hypothetical protein [Acidimicrobiales bacterium]